MTRRTPDIRKVTLVNMMNAGQAVLKETAGQNPSAAWQAAKAQNQLPAAFWDKHIRAAMDEAIWYALSTKYMKFD